MNILDIPLSIGFESVAIQQEKNICKSRLDVDISAEWCRGLPALGVPILAANMSSVTNADFCIKLERLGALGVLHRAWRDHDEYYDEVRKIYEGVTSTAHISASVGVGPEQVALAQHLIRAGAKVVFIDIAHGYCDAVLETAKAIKKWSPHTKIVVGNVVNTDAMEFYNDVADAVKVGVGQGLACETKNTAGATEKQFSAVLKFKEISKKLGLPIISDGGIREPADIVKAIAAGANSVMIGSAFARCPESAAPLVDGQKLYYGMASRRSQEHWRGMKPGTCPEGKEVYLTLGEPVSNLIERYSGALRSGITYAGAWNISTFQQKVKFVRLG